MKVFVETDARHDLRKMDRAERSIFGKYIDKIGENPYGRHMEHGLPFYSENFTTVVTKAFIFTTKVHSGHGGLPQGY